MTNTTMATDSITRFLGTGIYSISEAARYLHVPAHSVRRWSTGRPKKIAFRGISPTPEENNQELGRIPPVLLQPATEIDGEFVLSFGQLIEMRMIALFRKQGVSMPVIKAAAVSAAKLLNTDHPFSSFKMQTDGKRIFADLSYHDIQVEDADNTREIKQDRIVQDLKQLQVVMGDIVRIYFKDTDYEEDRASRWWLLGKGNRAVLDPRRGFGQPLDDQTGVPLSVLYELVKAGEPVEVVADWYKIDPEAVDTAVTYYTTLS